MTPERFSKLEKELARGKAEIVSGFYDFIVKPRLNDFFYRRSDFTNSQISLSKLISCTMSLVFLLPLSKTWSPFRNHPHSFPRPHLRHRAFIHLQIPSLFLHPHLPLETPSLIPRCYYLMMKTTRISSINVSLLTLSPGLRKLKRRDV